MKGLTWRFTIVFATLAFAIYLLIPSIIKFKTGNNVPKVVKDGDPWAYNLLPSETLKLGLDLMGGVHLVLGIDFNEVHRDAITKLKNQLKDSADTAKIEGITYETTADNALLVHYTSEDGWKKVEDIIKRDLGQYLDPISQDSKTARLGMTDLYIAEVNRRAIDQSRETLRNRIDEFGIAEPDIKVQGEEKVVVDFPGIQDPARLKEIISRTAKLSFHVVISGPEEPNGKPSPAELDKLVADYTKEKNIKLTPVEPITKHLKDLNAWAAAKLPPNTDLLFQKKMNVNTQEAEYTPYLLGRDALVTGEDLDDAYYSFNPQTNQPEVNFQLNPMGAGKFEKATGDNVGKFMAIVLDNNVHSAPRIKTKIPGGRAMIEMGSTGRSQNDVLNDAKDTSLVLRSGALPARLEFLEERVVGPSLGADAIRAGTYSLAAGLALVFLFMIIYYKASGVIACIALAMNGLFIISTLAAFEGTLTLPGLAGITLTLGMAVDANVLILEHMREELKAGKSFLLAVGEGYNRAFSAIIDGHVTTVIAGVVLLNFGYGPIRGFAVTLLIGLVASLFTSVFVTRVIFDYLMVARNRKTLSI